MKIKYNIDKDYSYFKNEVDILMKNGFKPIMVCQMLFEPTFVFKTEEESKLAYEKLELNESISIKERVIGWFYGEKEFIKEVKRYENILSVNKGQQIKVKVFFINEKGEEVKKDN
ncbi:hypothetical protein COY27_07090 [Candidatus Woesearchaeota archaeon CG_4_10_14_0_2_um_filter_33_13]|nr:MAG: hypothetical protein COY27_07090 [Candidatus Woesearchaeota archaeon CG_4_10_14_0_2_um_filter_33_13]